MVVRVVVKLLTNRNVQRCRRVGCRALPFLTFQNRMGRYCTVDIVSDKTSILSFSIFWRTRGNKIVVLTDSCVFILLISKTLQQYSVGIFLARYTVDMSVVGYSTV